jgi:hypothetical protein
MPASAAAPAPISEEVYLSHQTEISLLMSHFFVGYLRSLYVHFDGDLALVIVLAEIAHHNVAGHFNADSPADRTAIQQLEHDEATRARLPACNAYSLAAATGLPRETIRRKIARLENLGWVERGERREVRITPEVGRHFHPDFNLNLLRSLLGTADRIRAVLNPTHSPATR